MRGPFRLLSDYAASLAGRITLLLTLGIAGASIAALVVAEQIRIHALQSLQLERVVASTMDMAQRFARDSRATQDLIDRRMLFGVRSPFPHATFGPADPHLTDLLTHGLGPAARVSARRITSNCFGNMLDSPNRVAGLTTAPAVDCWQIAFDDGGQRHEIVVDLPALQIPHSGMLDPAYLVLIVMASALVSVFAARVTSVPLRRLADAARKFSVSIDPQPIPVNGPREVRAALETYNLMQQKVRDGFRERTQILAAITHDLQTPLTRLRLRLEQVADDELRARLIADLSAMQEMVRDGLELARSAENREGWSIVDVESLVTSLVEDHADMGEPVVLTQICKAAARVKPDALTRCLENLVSNAVKYGGGAEIACRLLNGRIEIMVSDQGPGIPPDRLNEMFEPFVRGDNSRSRTTGGTGIGLTIARAQALSFGATIDLQNRPQGGLSARLTFPCSPDGSADAPPDVPARREEANAPLPRLR